MAIDPVAFSAFGLEIRWYGIITALALLTGFTVAYFIARYRGQKQDEVLNFALIAVVVSLLGARFVHILANLSFYIENPIYIFAFRRGGLAAQGAILGGLITLIIFCRIRKLTFWQWADIYMPGLILGQAIGRWGNFINQEAFGRPTSLPWAIYIDPANRPYDYASYEFFHPTFLYESIANFLLFGILMLMHRYYKKRPGRNPDGLIMAAYLGIYSIYRTFIEYYRIDSTYWGPVKVVYVIDLITIIVAIVIANHVIKSFREKKQLEEGSDK